jgi:acyl-CoA reductase-like NAD-dependent aldehyde dehydrogenase
VEDSNYEKFADLLTKKALALKVGDQLLEDTDVGPLINEQAAAEVEAFVNGAVAAGAKLRAGGKRRGSFMEPTVLSEVAVDMPLFKEEVFGPVVPLVRFTTIDEDINKALDIAYRLEAGGVIINWSSALRVETLPFGGIKMSGHGREGVHDTLEEMTDQKTVVVHNAFPPVTTE